MRSGNKNWRLVNNWRDFSETPITSPEDEVSITQPQVKACEALVVLQNKVSHTIADTQRHNSLCSVYSQVLCSSRFYSKKVPVTAMSKVKKQSRFKTCVVVLTCFPSTQEAKAEMPQFQGQSGLHSRTLSQNSKKQKQNIRFSA